MARMSSRSTVKSPEKNEGWQLEQTGYSFPVILGVPQKRESECVAECIFWNLYEVLSIPNWSTAETFEVSRSRYGTELVENLRFEKRARSTAKEYKTRQLRRVSGRSHSLLIEHQRASVKI